MMLDQTLTPTHVQFIDQIDHNSEEMSPTPASRDPRQEEIALTLLEMSHTALRRFELGAEYVRILAGNAVGQVVPPKGGRQKKNQHIRQAARELTMLGKTEEARRKFLERAVRVDKISPDVKVAAKEAGLGDSVMALLEVAKASPEKQLDTIREISERGQAERGKKPAKTTAVREAAGTTVPELSTEKDATSLPVEYRDAASAVEAAWQAASDLRRALHEAPPPVQDWFAKRLRTKEEV
jgi:hypothetical protein